MGVIIRRLRVIIRMMKAIFSLLSFPTLSNRGAFCPFFLFHLDDYSLAKSMMQFGRTYDLNVAEIIFVMTRAWENSLFSVKSYDI